MEYSAKPEGFFSWNYLITDRIDNLRISGKALLRPTEFYYFENYYQDKHNKLKTKLEQVQKRVVHLIPADTFTQTPWGFTIFLMTDRIRLPPSSSHTK